MSPQLACRPRAEAITGLIPAARDYRPGLAFRVADLGPHFTHEHSPGGRSQRDLTPLQVALEMTTWARF
jgi:hypothetical protein